VSAVDGFLAPVVTEVLLTGLARLRAEGKGAHLSLGSPWLSNFPLFPGVFAGSFPHLLPDTEPSEVATIADVVATWRAYGGQVTVLVQNYGKDWPKKDNAQRNQEELALLARCLTAGADVLFGKGFHSKFIVCPDIVVSGSANMTYSGYYKNSEHLHVYRAQAALKDYETERMACLNHVASASNLGLCVAPEKLTGRLVVENLSALRQFVVSL
jgi:phosphatidylserine/phosphatidylglycerophosphate/cardiolipin synthase-like enzyme